MENIDIDKVLNVMNDPAFSENSKGLMEMLTEVNKVLGKLQHTMSMVDNMGLKELLVRAAGQKLGVDPETPLKSANPQGIIPQSTYHREVLAHMNSLSEEQLGQMLSALLSDEAKAVVSEPVLTELEAAE